MLTPTREFDSFEWSASGRQCCHLVLAREFRYGNWPQLKIAVHAASHKLTEEFVRLGILCYDDPRYDYRTFWTRASEMLRDIPSLAGANIWCASVAGNSEAVSALLDSDPDLVHRPGPHGWTPLICACYSRVRPLRSEHSTLRVVRVLLDRGADPNTFTQKGNADERLDQEPRRFTPLAGLVGGGSTGLANQPQHPQWRPVAELLLDRSANPADEQALALNQDACLELLLERGLKPDALGRDGVTLAGRALVQAARKGDAQQVRLLLSHGARTDERVNGKLPWEHAMRLGRREIARLLEDAGAPTGVLDDVGRFIAAIMAGDEPSARDMLRDSPDVRERAPRDLVHRAVWSRTIDAVRLALDLGFDPNAMEENGAIHHAGVLAEREDILQLLLARGASLKLRDPFYDSTGIGWADFFEYADLRNRLLNEPDICLFDALDFGRFDRVPDILARDPEALERPFAKCISRAPRPADWITPIERMRARGNEEGARLLMNHGAPS